jgi:hypothetical protein
MRATYPIIGLLTLAPLGAQAAQAPLRPLCADRPGKATPACILDVGHLQIESGLVEFTRSKSGDGTDRTYAIASTELRLGLTRRSEVEMAWTPWIVNDADTPTGTVRTTGSGDLTLGWRRSLTDPDRPGPAVAIRPFLTAPTATHHLGAGGWQAGLTLPMSTSLGADLSAAASPEVDLVRNAEGGGYHPAVTGVVALGRSWGPVALGAELWGSIDYDPAGTTRQATFDLTVAWTPQAAPNVQFDAGVNTGLDRQAPDLDLYVGVSRRF